MGKSSDSSNFGKLALAGIGFVISYLITSEPVQKGLDHAEKALKRNGHELIGDAVKIVKKTLGSVGNVARANPVSQGVRVITSKLTVPEARLKFRKGDHIAVDRFYNITHHGIYGGNGKVIHYDSSSNPCTIKKICLEEFVSPSHYVYRIDSPTRNGY